MIISKGKVINLKILANLFRNVYPQLSLFGFCLSIVIPDVSFLKLAIMIEHIKMMQIPHLDIWSMLLSGQVPQQAAIQVFFS